jgi:hypothetical protein
MKINLNYLKTFTKLQQNMGQLEVYNINEIYLNGIVISLFINYIAEELESNTFESFKPYFYSSNFANKK